MNKLFAIFWKDTRIRFSSKSEWLFFLILPLIFTFVLAGGTAGYADTRLRLPVADLAQSSLSAQLIEEIEASGKVLSVVKPFDQAETEFSQRKITTLLVIPANFNLETLRTGSLTLDLRQQPNNLESLAAQQAVQEAIGRLSSTVSIARQSVLAAEQIQPFATPADREAYFDASLIEAQQKIGAIELGVATTRSLTQDDVDFDPKANSSAGQLVTWVFIPLFGISGSFAYERVTGTLRRLFTTPTRKSTYLLGTIISAVFWALVQMLLLIGFGSIVMKLNWGQSPMALAAVLISSALAASAIGVTLGAFVKTEGQATGLSVLMGMVMALLGGCWYPLELFPNAVQEVVKILPTRWAMQGMLDLVLRQQGLNAVLPEVAVLLGFAALFYTIGILRFRYE